MENNLKINRYMSKYKIFCTHPTLCIIVTSQKTNIILKKEVTRHKFWGAASGTLHSIFQLQTTTSTEALVAGEMLPPCGHILQQQLENF